MRIPRPLALVLVYGGWVLAFLGLLGGLSVALYPAEPDGLDPSPLIAMGVVGAVAFLIGMRPALPPKQPTHPRPQKSGPGA